MRQFLRDYWASLVVAFAIGLFVAFAIASVQTTCRELYSQARTSSDSLVVRAVGRCP